MRLNKYISTIVISAALFGGVVQTSFAQTRVGLFGRLFGGYGAAYRSSCPTGQCPMSQPTTTYYRSACPTGQCPTSQPAGAYQSSCPTGQCPTSQPAAAYRSICPSGQCPFTPAASEIETTPGIDEPIEAVETKTAAETPEPCAPIETSESPAPCYPVETTAETLQPCGPVQTCETTTAETLQPCAPCSRSVCPTGQCPTAQPTAERPRPVANAIGRAANAPRAIAQRVAETVELLKANRIRARYGVGPLTLDANLSAAATAHSNAMASYGRIYHAPGCGWEIVAMNYGAGVVGALDQWTNSAAHFRILTNGGLTRVGVGHVRDRYGRDFCTMRFR